MTSKAPGRSKKNTSNAGFEEAFETHGGMGLGEDNDLQAWCDACEAIRQEEGGWNDLSQDMVELVVYNIASMKKWSGPLPFYNTIARVSITVPTILQKSLTALLTGSYVNAPRLSLLH